MKKIDSREYGLELGTVAMQYFFKSKALHYGYWEEDIPVELFNIGKAQERYTEKVVEMVPEGVETVLDVGCGTGSLAKALVEKSYKVECISPSHFLAEETRKQVDGILVHECKFEEFKTDKKYDLIVFCESFQYINLQEVFDLAKKLLNPDGKIIVSDMFKTHATDRGPIGGGHRYSDYLEIAKNKGLELANDFDMTHKIAPTFDVLHSFSIDFLKPFGKNLSRVLSANFPYVYKVVNWKFSKKIERFQRNFKPNRNGKGFIEFNTYRIMVWNLKDSAR